MVWFLLENPRVYTTMPWSKALEYAVEFNHTDVVTLLHARQQGLSDLTQAERVTAHFTKLGSARDNGGPVWTAWVRVDQHGVRAIDSNWDPINQPTMTECLVETHQVWPRVFDETVAGDFQRFMTSFGHAFGTHILAVLHTHFVSVSCPRRFALANYAVTHVTEPNGPHATQTHIDPKMGVCVFGRRVFTVTLTLRTRHGSTRRALVTCARGPYQIGMTVHAGKLYCCVPGPVGPGHVADPRPGLVDGQGPRRT